MELPVLHPCTPVFARVMLLLRSFDLLRLKLVMSHVFRSRASTNVYQFSPKVRAPSRRGRSPLWIIVLWMTECGNILLRQTGTLLEDCIVRFSWMLWSRHCQPWWGLVWSPNHRNVTSFDSILWLTHWLAYCFAASARVRVLHFSTRRMIETIAYSWCVRTENLYWCLWNCLPSAVTYSCRQVHATPCEHVQRLSKSEHSSLIDPITRQGPPHSHSHFPVSWLLQHLTLDFHLSCVTTKLSNLELTQICVPVSYSCHLHWGFLGALLLMSFSMLKISSSLCLSAA